MIIQDEIQEFFGQVPSMALSTTDDKSKPNVVAIGAKRIENNDTVWVIDTFFRKTKENILQNNKVAIAMWKDGKGYQFKGIAAYHSRGETFEKA